MGFNNLVAGSSAKMMQKFANCTVVVLLNGVQVSSFPGIFDERSETVQPFESERTVFHPVLTVESGNLSGITSAHAFQVGNGKTYKFDGKPQPDGTGFTVCHLGEQK